MSYKFLNLNPAHQNTGDCVVRAISVLMDQSWNDYEAQMIRDTINTIQMGR